MAFFDWVAHEARIEHVKKYGHIMIDLETLSTKTNASIIEIAAVEFNKETGEIGDTFDVLISPDDWVKNNRDINGNTLLWWMQQDKTLLSKFNNNSVSFLSSALNKFTDFYNHHTLCGENEKETIVWGNGSTMDITILQSAYEYFNKPIPWKYWAVNDVRTIVELNPEIKKNTIFSGDKHNPIDDCKHQIKYLVETLKSIKK